MSISTSHGVVADNPGHPERPSGARVAKDVARCEALLSHAARKPARRSSEADVDSVAWRALGARSQEVGPRRRRCVLSGHEPDRRRSAVSRAQRPPRTSGIAATWSRTRLRTAKTLEAGDVEALSKARDAQQNHNWNPEIEGAFYAAMSRISHTVAPVVAETAGRRCAPRARAVRSGSTRARRLP